MPVDHSETERSGYGELLLGIVALLERGRESAARSVNAVLTTTYWLVGQRLVEQEQRGGRESRLWFRIAQAALT